jgi:Leucine-rich repeat (LRR) protein
MTSLSGCFWDRVFSITGFRRRDIESLRDSSVNGGGAGSSSSDRDVIESISLVGTDWTDQAAVHTVRKELQEYVSLLRSLKAENKSKSQTRVHVRNYVDDARYSALRQREAAQRVTVAKVAGSFRTLRFDDCDIAQLTAEEPFPAVEDLRLSRNRLTELTFVPANVRVLTVASNRIRHVEIPSVHDKLLYLSLSANDVVDLAFLEHFPSLVMLDVSFNAISSVDDVVTMLDAVPTITEVDLRGNPVCFAGRLPAPSVLCCPHVAGARWRARRGRR